MTQETSSHMSEFVQTRLEVGRIVRFKLFLLLVLEFLAGIFALIPEVFFRIRFGRRYFSVLGIGATYFTTLCIYYICSAIRSLSGKASSFGTIEIDPLGLSQKTRPVELPDEVASPEMFFMVMKIFVVAALFQKGLCYLRKLLHREPSMATYGGESVFSFVTDMIPESLLKHVAFSSDDFSKRWSEPAVVFLTGTLLTEFDELVGSLFVWCSLALLIRAWSCRIRFQAEIDEMNDIRQHSEHLFGAIDSSRNGSSERATAKLS